MTRRSKFFILCMVTSLFTVVIWITGDDGNIIGDSQSVFKIEKQKDEENVSVENVSASGSLGNNCSAETSLNKTVLLMWTKYYAVRNSELLSLILSGRKWDSDCCSGNDTVVTLDRSLLSTATAVVFFNYPHNLKKKDLPPFRPPGQLWVLFCKESPVHSVQNFNQFSNQFNWTMSYRRDSDIWSPYGITIPLEQPIAPFHPILMPGNIPLSHWIANKTKILAGVISHCPTNSKREGLVTALRNSFLPVDIFGTCGNHKTCPRSNKTCNHQKFWSDLASAYKFYFAAENSLCVDYITEKFWRALELGLVPLVYGGANYTSVAPPNSFIDTRQFTCPQEMASFLLKLSNDPVEYSKYFEWKRNYKVIMSDGWGGWCKLCALAKQYKNKNIDKMTVSPYKSYASLTSWWHRAAVDSKTNACVRPSPSFHF